VNGEAWGHSLIDLVSVPVALAVLFLLVSEALAQLPDRVPRPRLYLLAYVALVLAALLLSIEPVPGVRVDARNGVVAMATLALGPAGGLVVAAAGALVRLLQGGIGAVPGAVGLGLTWLLVGACCGVAGWRRQATPADPAGPRSASHPGVLLAAGLGAALVASGTLAWIAAVNGLSVGPSELLLSGVSPGLTTVLLGGLRRYSLSRSAAIRQARQVNARLGQALHQTIGALSAAILHSDPAGAAQQKRVADLAQAIGRRLGLDAPRLEGLALAALVHDVGQIEVPGEILARPGPLTPAEHALVQLHPAIGHDILKDVDFPWPLAEIVHQHHENLDGSGYPRGLRGEQIVLEARILRVCDVVEAMCSHRVYRAAVGREQALAEIERMAGRELDACVVAACLALFHEQGYELPRV
jgi:hypothetical protein